MFDWLYAIYVNSRLVRMLYGLGFFLFWASWAQKSLTVTPTEVTWLVFGWLPAVFWPIQAIVDRSIPILPDLWGSSVQVTLAGLSFDLPWGALIILGVPLVFAWYDIKDLLQLRDRGEEPKPSPAE